MLVKVELAFIRLEFEVKAQYEVLIFDGKTGELVKESWFYTKMRAVAYARSVTSEWGNNDMEPFDWYVRKHGVCLDCGSVVIAASFRSVQVPLNVR